MAAAEPEFQITPSVLSPCSSGRRSSVSNSPEFEFWMLRNQTLPPPELLPADELFSGGVLLPLHLLHLNNRSLDEPPDRNQDKPDTQEASGPGHVEPKNGSGSSVIDGSSVSAVTSSKRWKDIFKKSESSKEREKEKKKEKKNGIVGRDNSNGIRAAELNINIWPFSRSRSAGNSGSRPRMAASSNRKVSSAPCSRSNSTGDSKSRKWPSSPNRGGVHLGRNSPVWQVRRAAVGGGSGLRAVDPVVVKNGEKSVKKESNEGRRKQPAAVAVGGDGGGAKAKVLQLNVPMCIGYRHRLSCRSDENSAIGVAAAAAAGAGVGTEADEGTRGSNIFSIKNLFTKKVY